MVKLNGSSSDGAVTGVTVWHAGTQAGGPSLAARLGLRLGVRLRVADSP